MEMKLVDIGNINYVYKMSINGKNFFLKQARSKFRKKFPGDEHIPLGDDRLLNELKAIDVLNVIFKDSKFNVPDVHYMDKENNLALLSEIKGETVLQNIKSKVLNEDFFKLAGEFIGFQHSKTVNTDIKIRDDDFGFFKKLIYFRSVLSSRNLIEKRRLMIKEKFEKIFREGFTHVLVNGDYSPKQLFVDGDNLGICDLEFVCNGDGAYDIGFFIANCMLEGAIQGIDVNPHIKIFLLNYFKYVKAELVEKRINFYMGTGLLDRVDGTSKDPRISDDLVKIMREKALDIITRGDLYGL